MSQSLPYDLMGALGENVPLLQEKRGNNSETCQGISDLCAELCTCRCLGLCRCLGFQVQPPGVRPRSGQKRWKIWGFPLNMGLGKINMGLGKIWELPSKPGTAQCRHPEVLALMVSSSAALRGKKK